MLSEEARLAVDDELNTAVDPLADFNNQLDYEEGEEEGEDVVKQLYRVWLNERASPEILPHPTDILHDVLELIDNQTNQLSALRLNGNAAISTAFTDCIYQMDLERIKYVVKSLTRCRMAKIERAWAWLSVAGNDNELAKLSVEEREYLARLRDGLIDSLNESVLDLLPPALANLNDSDMTTTANPQQHFSSLGISKALMYTPLATPPVLESHVICRVRRDLGEIIVDPVSRATCPLDAGDVFILQYQVIRNYLLNGDVELL